MERYRSPDGYRAEIARLFTRLPSMLVHASEIPEPGSFVTPDGGPEPKDLDAFLGDFLRDIKDLNLAEFEVHGAESHEWDINWNPVVEGRLEGYRFPFLHTKSANPLFEPNTFFYDSFGPHLRSILPKRSINFVTGTEHGERRLLPVADVIHTAFPNETVLRQSDHFLWITSHPLGPARTLVKLRLLVPPGSAGARGAAGLLRKGPAPGSAPLVVSRLRDDVAHDLARPGGDGWGRARPARRGRRARPRHPAALGGGEQLVQTLVGPGGGDGQVGAPALEHRRQRDDRLR